MRSNRYNRPKGIAVVREEAINLSLVHNTTSRRLNSDIDLRSMAYSIGTTRTPFSTNLATSRIGFALVMFVLASLVGCGKSNEPIAFDSISRLPTNEDLVEIKIGSFIVPIPLVLNDTDEHFEVDNRVQINFDLVAVVDPMKQSKVEKLIELHAGKIRNEVMRVCRNTSHVDIVEADWTTFKAHLLDAIQPYLGGAALRRLVMPRIVKELL